MTAAINAGKRKLGSCVWLLVLFLVSAGAAKSVTLRWATWGPQKVDTELIEAFEAAYPEVKIEYIFSSGTGEHHPKMKVLSAAGLAPDVFAVDGVYLAEFASTGLIQPLDHLINADRSFRLSDFFPASLPDVQYNGKTYGLPYISAPMYILYNVNHVQEAGLPKPDVHWDWNTFVSYGRKLMRTVEGRVTRWATTGYLNRTATHFEPWVWSAGGEVFDESKKRFLLTEPEAVAALDFLAEMQRTGLTGGGNFAQQTVSITRLYPGGFPTVTGVAWPFEWDVTLFPAGAGGQYTIWKGNVMAMAPNTPHQEEAWQLIKFLLAPGQPGYSIYIKNKRFPPQTRDRDTWALFHTPGQDPVSLWEVTLLMAADYSRPLPQLVQWNDIMDQTLGPALVQIQSGTVSARVAMEQVKPIIESMLVNEP
ncbi:MAG: sugar ABC transporter substrate-binding protein [Firmicutes bacterium]|jgi:multiple sugar transport system substrate-binding protein|nr:sugar ABC transporter substrate-binding protein [Bacillota bacterium]